MDSTRNNTLNQATVHSAGSVQKDSERILSSKRFAISEELMGILPLLIQEILKGSEVKTESLRVALSDQDQGFHPGFDPLARVQARRVRNRLKRYYQTVGIDDPIRIELSPKTYIPLIRWREPEQAVPPYFIGVRQFRSLSSDPEASRVCEYLKTDLLKILCDTTQLRIVDISEADQEAAVREICSKLKLDAVLDAKLRKAAGRLRISVRLMSASDGSVLWDEKYECLVENLAVIRVQVVHRIARNLHAESLSARQIRSQRWKRLA